MQLYRLNAAVNNEMCWVPVLYDTKLGRRDTGTVRLLKLPAPGSIRSAGVNPVVRAGGQFGTEALLRAPSVLGNIAGGGSWFTIDCGGRTSSLSVFADALIDLLFQEDSIAFIALPSFSTNTLLLARARVLSTLSAIGSGRRCSGQAGQPPVRLESVPISFARRCRLQFGR